ncbi:MAG: hypothetical protein JRJ84_21775 [Deltaproteobacteria bacterium]|nr:hypothetical protein [Deltaproteobacteria bacterium]
MAQRNGLEPVPGGHEDVRTPEEVLALSKNPPGETLAATRAALRFGHLEHWEETESGRRALEALRQTGF